MLHKRKSKDKDLFLLGIASLLWLIVRTGTKPSRIMYPCQRVALANISVSSSLFLPLLLAAVLAQVRKVFSAKGCASLLLIILGILMVVSGQLNTLSFAGAVNPNHEVQLILESRNASVLPSSDLYVVNGREASHISVLLDLMGSRGLKFYQANTSAVCQGPEGLIAKDDIVLIKINEEWPYRGGTNTDVLKELIQAIIDHPEGFDGEIVVADNGQWQGSMNWIQSNAENISQSTQNVVDLFSGYHNVSTFSWRPIRGIQVNEYSDGDITDGYILYPNYDPETGIRVSYPKFKTKYGTCISFKHGIWNGTGYEKRLKIVNLPVLKSHSWYGVTASVKHYMGVQSEGWTGGLANGHDTVGTGGMGKLMVETGLPTLNIIDAIWVNANPPPSTNSGPSTPYSSATRTNVLTASIDPIALDYWAAKNVLMQTAQLVGYIDTSTINPDEDFFGRWLNRSRDVMTTASYNVTNYEERMNVYVFSSFIHDLAVSSVVPSKKIIGVGSMLQINATVLNQGDFFESFNVTAFYNNSTIETLELFSEGRTASAITFSWDTTNMIRGNYTISISASIIPDEINTTNNISVNGCVFLTVLGDINGDRTTDISDIAMVIAAYGKNTGTSGWFAPDWIANRDVNNDRRIGTTDIAIVIAKYGSYW